MDAHHLFCVSIGLEAAWSRQWICYAKKCFEKTDKKTLFYHISFNVHRKGEVMESSFKTDYKWKVWLQGRKELQWPSINNCNGSTWVNKSASPSHALPWLHSQDHVYKLRGQHWLMTTNSFLVAVRLLQGSSAESQTIPCPTCVRH